MNAQSLLWDLYDHFQVHSSPAYAVSAISHGLRTQYISLVRFVALEPSTLNSVRAQLTLAADQLPRFFQGLETLSSYQKEVVARLAHEETKLNFVDYNLELELFDCDLSQQIKEFLVQHSWHEDTMMSSIFHASLGITLVSVEHLADLHGLSEAEVQQRMEHLRELWQHEHLITTIHPRNYEDLMQRLDSLSAEQWQILETRWRGEVKQDGGATFKDRLRVFMTQFPRGGSF